MPKVNVKKLLLRHRRLVLAIALVLAVGLELFGMGVIGEVVKRGIDLAGLADIAVEKVEEL